MCKARHNIVFVILCEGNFFPRVEKYFFKFGMKKCLQNKKNMSWVLRLQEKRLRYSIFSIK